MVLYFITRTSIVTGVINSGRIVWPYVRHGGYFRFRRITPYTLHACGLKRGRGTWFGLNLGVFEPDFDETDTSLRWGEGRLKLTLCTEAGILVFDMGG